jgi:DNA modification methylase
LREKWSTATGQLWQLGDHRLVCGDCTDAAVVARVMDGEKAAFCFTDPPYNVGKDYGKGTNDNQKRGDFVAWCKKWAAFLPPSFALTVGVKRLLWWGEILGDPDWVVAWVKMNGAAQSGIAGPNKWDPILLYRVLHDKKSDVIEISNSYTEGGEHPTSKPVDLWCEVISRFSQDAPIVYDPFLGSGTTLIACERLGRRCRAVEIEPGYVAVALQRWHDMTGVEPVLLPNSGGTVDNAT